MSAERLAEALIAATPYAGFLGVEAAWIDGAVAVVLPYRRP